MKSSLNPQPTPPPQPPEEILLTNLRGMMDDADEELVVALAYRYWLSEMILATKQKLGQALHSPERETRILERVTKLGTDLKLPAEVVQMIYYQLLGHPFRKFEPL